MSILLRIIILSLSLLCSAFLENARAEQVDLRPLQTAVKDQKNRDTCAYFAASALVESAIKNLTGQDYDISEEYEVFRNKVIHAWRPEVEFGNTYNILQNLANDLYFYQESVLPYQPQNTDFLQAPKIPANSPRVDFRGLRFKQLTQMWIRKPWSEFVMDELRQKRPVVITLKVAIPEVNDAKGTFSYNAAIDQQCIEGKIQCGGHAVLLVGFDSERKLFIFKNSWGPLWGIQGYGSASFDHIDNYSDQLMTAYFDKLTSPTVRERIP